MSSAFVYDAERDIYLCPAGEKLTIMLFECKERSALAPIQKPRWACRTCVHREQCASKKPAADWRRSITRIEEPAATLAFKAKMNTEQAKQIYDQRSQIAEFRTPGLSSVVGYGSFDAVGD